LARILIMASDLFNREARRRRLISQLANEPGGVIAGVDSQVSPQPIQQEGLGISKQDFSKVGAALQIAQAGAAPAGGLGLAGQVAGPAVAGGTLGGVGGAAIGAGVGLVGGLAGLSARKEARKRQAQADAFLQISKIEGTRGAKRQQALQNIVSALRGAFLG
jgi:hypothetical protein